MRPDNRPYRLHARQTAAGGVPVVLAGSLALLMTAAPASAAESTRSTDHKAPGLRADNAGPRALPASAEAVPESYTVQAGDTVSTIASRHGLRTAEVLALNGLDWSSIIHPGDVLRLAAAASVPVAPPTEPAAPAAPAAPAEGAYVVQGGDTISAIAERHAVSVPALLSANALEWLSIIYPGQTIAIPGSASAAPEQAVPPAAPPAEAPPTSGPYVVGAGDTISAIAHAHGVTTQAVLDANALAASSIIYPGQTLAIPSAIAPVLAVSTEPAPAGSSALDAEQIGNVQIIIAVGRQVGVPDQGIAIALGTAMQESWLRNLDWGDRDSLGLFQQRPSTGWGTPEQVRDPDRSSRAFYGGPSDPNGSTTRGLLDIDGWQSMSFADAAQAVQISAYPDRYAQWEQPAYTWLATYG